MSTAEGTRTRNHLAWASLGIAGLAAWLVVILRVQPWPFSDYAAFLAVARRLNAGDVLYQEIWDNKDPFVYYSLALLQDIGQPALWALEVAWFLIAAIAVYAIARRYGLEPTWAFLAGGILTPLVLIPFHYFPGTTHLPGVALSLAAIAAFTRQRGFLAGVAIGFLWFFKLSMLPIPLVAIAVIAFHQRRPDIVTRALAGLGAVLAAGLVILLLRAEFIPYVDSLIANFTYAQTNTQTGGSNASAIVSERLAVLTDPHVLITAITILVIVLVTARSWRTNQLWQLTTATFATGALLIIAIGKFPHHAQVLGVSAALAIVLVLTSLGSRRHARPIASTALAALVTLALTGLPDLTGYRDSLVNWRGTWQSMTERDPYSADLFAGAEPSTYAIVQGGGLPRSPGLEEWDLVCRHIAQRPWESAELLQESLDCFPNAEVLLLPRDFAPANEPEDFAAFTRSVADLIASDYICVEGRVSTVCSRR